MASTKIGFEATKSLRAEVNAVIDAGETEVILELPEEVPDGQKLVLSVTIVGRYVPEAETPADSVSIGTVEKGGKVIDAGGGAARIVP